MKLKLAREIAARTKPRFIEIPRDMFVTGEADFTRSPLPIRADEYFVWQTR